MEVDFLLGLVVTLLILELSARPGKAPVFTAIINLAYIVWVVKS